MKSPHSKHKPDSEVTSGPAEQSPEDKKEEASNKNNASTSIKDSDNIVPQLNGNQSVAEPHSKDNVTSASNGTTKDVGKSAGDHSGIDLPIPAGKSKETEKSDQKSDADEAKQKSEGVTGEDSADNHQAGTKTESTDHDQDDSGPADISNEDVETKTSNNSVANNTVHDSSEGEKKPDTPKSVGLVTDRTVQTANSISPSLPDQSTQTESGRAREPLKYFSTQTPSVVTPANGSNFSFFRLFILTSVVFVVLYVGYYYRHKIKRHFGNNGNEIYYHPLRTMQHNAVD